MSLGNLNGLLLVDKPSGLTSHDTIASVRKILGTKEVGHSGTLDPLASGLLVCLVNEGTKLSQFILEGDKAYIVKMQFGLVTNTLDIQGDIIKNEKTEVNKSFLLETALAFQGEMSLQVPLYSAMKINGKKLYEYARENQEVEIPKKQMKFWDVSLIEHFGDSAEFFVRCSKGSFIRTWVDEIGKKLGCGACVTQLRRVQSSQFNVSKALTLQNLGSLVEQIKALPAEAVASKKIGELWDGAFVSMGEALPHLKKIRVQGQDESLLMNGQISHRLKGYLISRFDPSVDASMQVVSQDTGRLLALVELQEQRGFAIRRVFR
jgi:tRNA pseudouridine55 synthase